ncbi:uncharacterized protein HKW66_Vig0174340 [Vigna angularis]|uniref:Uncharacterized protein n=1 Tax=Phaseolus angularis TaxID=3914 RepID=A0A8T0JLR3_PHAAN|nr:uncharacterized protein HKW66_Vig0174340 [Vigna angularis]
MCHRSLFCRSSFIPVFESASPSIEPLGGLAKSNTAPYTPSLHEHSIKQVLHGGAHLAVEDQNEEKGQQRVVEEVVAEVGGVVGFTGGPDADVPEDLVIGDDLEEKRGVAVAAAVGVEVRVAVGDGAEVDGGGVDGAAHVGEGCEFLEGLGGLEEAAATNG